MIFLLPLSQKTTYWLKRNQFMVLQFCSSEAWNGSQWAKIQMSAGLGSFYNLQKRIHLLSFLKKIYLKKRYIWLCWVLVAAHGSFCLPCAMWGFLVSACKPYSRKWQPTPVFLPGKLHRQRNLAGYSHGVTSVRHILVTKPPPSPWGI